MVRTFLKVHTQLRLAFDCGIEVTESSDNTQHISTRTRAQKRVEAMRTSIMIRQVRSHKFRLIIYQCAYTTTVTYFLTAMPYVA